ncbi:unnamed protein product [Acanthoscelides obtectus]|uniref:Uncharacterized protein n=1 Tax=Acanthoscelides obtectus TaxID=200917 RepID=A0A9P0JRG4_ACAOB|nr:unnamed protein product [Acanthoscelides obtectus]CAK1679029.1 hypothetical protein AOBTE_LOCUS32095 [Acanthoscelides obtectus]
MEESDKIKPEDRPILNNLRYKFCKENNKHLLEYLKTASEHQRSSSCNHEQHRLFQELYPMDSALKNELSKYLHKPVDVIDITLSEDGDENIDESLESNQDSTNNISTKLNQTTIDDLIYAIKECLGNQTYLDSSILNNLQSSSLETYHVFKDLSQVLNHKEAINLGISLISSSVSSELLIEHYIHHLLIKELSLEFSEGLLNLINDVSLNHEDILIQELTTYLSNTEDNLKISLQFLERVNNDLKSKLLRYTFILYICKEVLSSIALTSKDI